VCGHRRAAIFRRLLHTGSSARPRLHAVACTWSLARGRLRVVTCIWLLARGRLHVVACTWSFARGRLHMVACTWSLARGRLHVVVCVPAERRVYGWCPESNPWCTSLGDGKATGCAKLPCSAPKLRTDQHYVHHYAQHYVPVPDGVSAQCCPRCSASWLLRTELRGTCLCCTFCPPFIQEPCPSPAAPLGEDTVQPVGCCNQRHASQRCVCVCVMCVCVWCRIRGVRSNPKLQLAREHDARRTTESALTVSHVGHVTVHHTGRRSTPRHMRT